LRERLKTHATNTIAINIITQYNGFALHKSVAIIEAIIPTTYETKVIIPFDIGSLIG
jgi:hypothetical protein